MPIIDMEPPANFGSDTRVDTFHQPPCQEINMRSDLDHPSGSSSKHWTGESGSTSLGGI